MRFQLLLLSSALLFSVAHTKPLAQDLIVFRKNFSRFSVEEITHMFADGLSSNTPRQTNKYITFSKVSSNANNLIFSLRISKKNFISSTDIVDIDTNNDLKFRYIRNATHPHFMSLCSTPSVYVALEKGMSITYNCFWEDGSYFGTSAVSLRDCDDE